MDLKQLRTFSRLQLTISYLIKVILIMAVIAAAINREWEILTVSLLALILTFIPAFFERNYKINLPSEFELAIVLFIYASIFLGEVRNYYVKFWWWDAVLHAGSGVMLGFIGFLILYILYYQKKLAAAPRLVAIFSFCFAVALGTIWEIFEFAMDSVFNLNMQKSGLRDTMWDLIVNSAGALVISLIGYFYFKQKSDNLFGRLIHKFLARNPVFTRKRK